MRGSRLRVGLCVGLLVALFSAGAHGQGILANYSDGDSGIFSFEHRSMCFTLDALLRGPVNLFCDVKFDPGSRGWDIRTFGARILKVNAGSPPIAAGMTISITSGQASGTLGGTGYELLQKNDYLYIPGAGTVSGLVPPSTATITAAVNNSETVTGTVVANARGSNTYYIKIVNLNTSGGTSEASSEFKVSNAQAPGPVGGSNLVACHKASGYPPVNTCTTSTDHPMVVGCKTGSCGVVQIINTTNDKDFGGGVFVVTSAPTTRTFTYQNGQSIGGGSASSANGGSAFFYNSIHIVPGKPCSWICAIYISTTSGEEQLVSTTTPQSAVNPDPTFNSYDWYGVKMSGGRVNYPWLPSKPPASPSNNALSAYIVSIAGTSVTLSARAAGTVTDGVALFDDGPEIVQANNAANQTAGATIIPSTGNMSCWPVASYIAISGGVEQSGCLWLNNTLQFQGQWYGDRPYNAKQCVQPQFAVACYIPIYANYAKPGIYMTGGRMQNVAIAVEGNDGVGLFYAAAGSSEPSYRLEHMTFLDTNTDTDYTSVGLYDFEHYIAGSFGNVIEDVSFIAGPRQIVGTTLTPYLIIKNNSEIKIDYAPGNRRGAYLQGAQTGGVLATITQGQENQGTIMPLWAGYFCGGTLGGSITINDTVIDTAEQSLFSNLGCDANTFQPFLAINRGAAAGSGGPSLSGWPMINGLKFSSSSYLQFVSVGQNYAIEYDGPAYKQINEPLVVGNPGSLIVGQIETPTAAPTVTVTTKCNGFPPPGIWSLEVISWDVTSVYTSGTGGHSLPSPASKKFTLNGSNCAIVNAPALPAGSFYWGVGVASGPSGTGFYIHAQNGSACGPSFIPVSITSFTWQSAFFCQGVSGINTSSIYALTPTNANLPTVSVRQLNQMRSDSGFANICTFSSSTTCTVSFSKFGLSFRHAPVVILTPINPGSVTFTLNSAPMPTGFTITASSPNSLSVQWLAIGNPN